jgi:hypothetical protein
MDGWIIKWMNEALGFETLEPIYVQENFDKRDKKQHR